MPDRLRAKSVIAFRRNPHRTTDALHAALAEVIDRITTRDAAGFFHHCGYAC